MQATGAKSALLSRQHECKSQPNWTEAPRVDRLLERSLPLDIPATWRLSPLEFQVQPLIRLWSIACSRSGATQSGFGRTLRCALCLPAHPSTLITCMKILHCNLAVQCGISPTQPDCARPVPEAWHHIVNRAKIQALWGACLDVCGGQNPSCLA